MWQPRCRLLIGLTWFHVVLISLAGPVLGYRWEFDLLAFAREGSVLHPVGEALIVAVFATIATLARGRRTAQAIAVAIGLMSASAILVHLSGGYIEFHFHFFVMLVFLALLQDWIPFLVAVAYVALHHGTVGVLWPGEVYNHPAALAAPWAWAGLHALFVLWSCVGSVLAWRLNERVFARTTLVLEAAGEGIFGIDAAGRITFMNQAAAAMIHTRARNEVGRPVHEAVRLVGPDGASVPEDLSPIMSTLRDRQPRHVTDARFRRTDGSSVPVDYRSTPIIERDLVTGAVVTCLDISERKQAEIAHAEVEEQLRQSQKMDAIGRLAGGVAHDFNNLLTVIGTQMDMALRRLPADEPVRERLQETKEAANQAARLTRQLLALSRKQILQPTVQSLNDVVGGLATMLPRLIGEDIALVVTLAPSIERARVDRGQVEQVVMNLVVNARDAMPDGGRLAIETGNVELDAAYVRQHPGVAPGRYVMLAVSDTGCGMDEPTRSRIFEPFFTTKAPGRGTGLGLSTVYGIVTQSGGHVHVYSEPGSGSCFKIYFPRVEEEVPAAPDAVDVVSPGGRETVLLVEDEAMLRRVARDILEDLGYTVLSASNGTEAAQVAARYDGPVDLLLTDVVMPGMSGRAVAELILAARPGMRVLYMSGYTDGAIAHHGVLDAGVAYLEKPFTIETLSAKVRAVLDAAPPRPVPAGR
jgi:PAS domain S-box-containing protein